MPKPIFQKNDLVILMKDNIKLLQELDKQLKLILIIMIRIFLIVIKSN